MNAFVSNAERLYRNFMQLAARGQRRDAIATR